MIAFITAYTPVYTYRSLALRKKVIPPAWCAKDIANYIASKVQKRRVQQIGELHFFLLFLLFVLLVKNLMP